MQIKAAGIWKRDKDKSNGKCRRWRLWVLTEEEGRKTRCFDGTHSMATKALEAYKVELGAIIPNAESFGAYVEARVRARAESGDISPNTIAKEWRCVRAIRRSPLDGMRIDAIKPGDCRKSLKWIRDNPQRPKLTRDGVLSGTSMLDIYRFARQTFEQLVDDELLARNPMAKIKDPKPDTPEVEALSWEELMGLLDWLDTLPMSGYVMAMYLIVCQALRRGESVAVLDAEVLPTIMCVSQAIKEATGEVGPPKSEAGKRDLPVMPRLAAKVEQMRAWKRARGLADAKPLACNVQGGYIRPQNLYRWWREMRKGTAYAEVRLHQLRHSTLTHMARSMSAFDLMDFAGWSSLEPTRTYIHDDYTSVYRGVCVAWGIQESDTIRLAA